jgi:hypothetical protein
MRIKTHRKLVKDDDNGGISAGYTHGINCCNNNCIKPIWISNDMSLT